MALLGTSSVFVHLDPRSEEVRVPAWFKKQPQLVLQVGLNMPVPIPDLDVGDEALSCTLSFNRRPEFCWIPWDAIYGLVGEDGRGMIWPDDVPPEVAAQAQGRPTTAKRHLEAVPSDGESAAQKRKKRKKASALRAVEADRASGEAEPGAVADTQVMPGESTPGEPMPDEASTREPSVAAEDPSSEQPPRERAGKEKRELPPYLRIVK